MYSSCQSDLAYDVASNRCLEPEFVPSCPGGVATEPTNPPVTQPPPFGKLKALVVP